MSTNEFSIEDVLLDVALQHLILTLLKLDFYNCSILKRFIKITLLNANYEEAIDASMGKQCRPKVEVNFIMKAKYTMCRLNGIPF